ncbi:MAG: ATP phosphoribosyltransferase regulatory subunit, partial [Bacteriovoracaceae bacterium]
MSPKTSLSKKPYKGCRDFFPKESREREHLFDAMKKSAEAFAYEPFDGPMVEEVELYKAKSGEELINDQIYDFTDRGGRHVAIRPEMTPTVARMVAQVHKQTPKPIRWYSIPNLMRYEKPQRGRLREHWQFNVDIFGAPEHLGEIEVLNVIASLM